MTVQQQLPQANDQHYSSNGAVNVQPTFSQRCNQRAANDAIAKQNFPKFHLQSTNSLFKLNQPTT